MNRPPPFESFRMSSTHIRTFYPADPAGIVPGGVDTFLRGLFKWAPADLSFSLVGMTTDAAARPVGHWTRCDLGRRQFDFFPVLRVRDAGRRSRLPLSVRYCAATLMRLRTLRRGFDVAEFHRIEPALLFGGDPRPRNAFFHQDMAVIRTEAKADILWRHLPGLYFGIERRVVSGLSSAWCVRQEGAQALRERFPAQAATIRFVPTWVDPENFAPVDEDERRRRRAAIAAELGLDPRAQWIVSVGRLDSQKDPALLAGAVARLAAQGRDVAWLVVGDGVLRGALAAQVEADGIAPRVRFLGLQAPAAIARLLTACDVYALSSAYESMPMAVLEALGTGLPVATTDVGEVRQVVRPGVNGAIAASRDLEAFAACLDDVLCHCGQYRGEPALHAVERFRPADVLRPVYDNYRELGTKGKSGERTNDARVEQRG